MNIFVVRHGQTDWNVKDLLQGCTNIDLNEVGLLQAKEVSKALSNICFEAIYASPLNRTLCTAQAINDNRNLPILTDNRLLERGFGDYEGIPGKKINFKKYWDYDANLSDHGVEPIKSFFNRIRSFLEDIISVYGDTDCNILIVTHNGVNLAIDSIINGLPENIFTLNLKPCQYKYFDNVKLGEIYGK